MLPRTTSPLRTFLILVLALLGALASAGQYVVTYSGGQIDGAGSAAGAYSDPLGLVPYGTGYSYSPRTAVDAYGGQPRSSYGSSHLYGRVTATLTWTPATDPLPASVILYEWAVLRVSKGSNGSGTITVAPTLGDPQQTVTRSSSGSRASLERFRVITNPGATLTVTFDPEAGANGYPVTNNYFAYEMAATFQVDAQAPTVTFSGGTPSMSTLGSYLVGQRMSATVVAPFGLTPTASGSTPARQWSLASNGDPFKSFEWTRSAAFTQDSSGVRRDLASADLQATTLQACFARPDSETVACVTHLAVPAGALPVAGLDASVSAQATIKLPLTPVAPQVVWNFRPRITDETLRDGASFSERTDWTAGVETPPAYRSGSDVGGWLWTQTLSLGSTRTLNPVAPATTGVKETEQMGPDAAGNYHLNGIDINFGYAPTRPVPGDPTPAGTFTAPDGVQLFLADGHATGPNDGASDAPVEPLNGNVASYALNNRFTTWLMYRPPGQGSQFVPIMWSSWPYSAQILWNEERKAWTISRGSLGRIGTTTSGGVPSGSPVPFPQWDRILYPSKIVYRQSDAHTLP